MYGHKALRVCTNTPLKRGHQSQPKELTLSHTVHRGGVGNGSKER